MPDDTGKVLAFRKREPAPPKPDLEWLRDYGALCNGMQVSLTRATGMTDNGDHFLLSGPDIEPVSLMKALPSMSQHDRDVIGYALYRVLYHSTYPQPQQPA